MTDEREVYDEFHRVVNMAPGELEGWLSTEEARAVEAPEVRESLGQRSGRRILELLCAGRDELNRADYGYMRRVVAFARRQLAQRPTGEARERWRHTLMSFGHDPLKGGR